MADALCAGASDGTAAALERGAAASQFPASQHDGAEALDEGPTEARQCRGRGSPERQWGGGSSLLPTLRRSGSGPSQRAATSLPGSCGT